MRFGKAAQPSIGAAQPIPDAEIEAIIAAIVAVMALVMRRGNQPAPGRAIDDRPRKHLPAHMVGDAHDRHDRQQRGKRAPVQRHRQHQRGDHHRAGQRFPWMEAHRRPGGRWPAGVMHRVRDAERLGPVHPAVRPVEPCIVREQAERERHRPPPERPSMEIGIDARPAVRAPAPGEDARRDTVDRRRGQAPADLAPHLPVEPRVETGMATRRRPGEPARDREIAQPHDQRHRECGKKQGEHRHGRCLAPIRSLREWAGPIPRPPSQGSLYFNHDAPSKRS